MGRLTNSRLIPRAVAHLSIVTLIAVITAAGVASSATEDPFVAPVRGAEPFAFDLIATARGAAADAEPLRALTIELVPDPERENLTVSRRLAVTTPAPLSTPVPPTETPIPEERPATAVGTTDNASAPAPAAPTPAPAPAAAPPAPANTGAATRLGWPVPGGTVSQYFHAGHLAIDIAAPYGSTVVAAAEGRVSWAGWRNNGGGLVVAIDHGGGLVTRYNHLGSIWVSPGQWVARGQGIAGVGCTGICTGPHVHFEAILNGVAINPLRLM